jgi:hypothetical protein
MVKGDDVDEGRKCSNESQSERRDRQRTKLAGKDAGVTPLAKKPARAAPLGLVELCAISAGG